MFFAANGYLPFFFKVVVPNFLLILTEFYVHLLFLFFFILDLNFMFLTQAYYLNFFSGGKHVRKVLNELRTVRLFMGLQLYVNITLFGKFFDIYN